VKGSFTGATADRKGKFEEADDGTIFLDEIGDLELQAQVKLLRVLEAGELQRVGSDKAYKVNVKVIAATHRDLESMVEAGTFREDLYYRINMCPLWIPPLRERRDEIEILFEHFLEDARSATRGGRVILNEKLRQFIFQTYEFPGNIRELKNLAKYIAYIAGAEPVKIEDLPARYRRHAAARAAGVQEIAAEPNNQLDTVRAIAEKDFLIGVMQKHRGKVQAICQEMEISRSRLYQLLSKFNLRAADYR
jgi:DNA-binding NtrC family response regulator